MPHYELYCHTCKKAFSRMLALVDWAEGEITCPHCGSHDADLPTATNEVSQEHRLRRILLCTDFSENSERALNYAISATTE